MNKLESGKPEASEHAEYYGRYIRKVEGTDVVSVLEEQLHSTLTLLRGIDERTADFRYEPAKWSIKELAGHIIDTERVFAYRALVFSRSDSTPQPGFDQDQWAEHDNYSNLTLAQIATEFEAVRRATILLFRHMDPSAWLNRGTADGKNFTTRSAAFVIAGHVQHHIEILKTRYLSR
jgi:hypothetical protein